MNTKLLVHQNMSLVSTQNMFYLYFLYHYAGSCKTFSARKENISMKTLKRCIISESDRRQQKPRPFFILLIDFFIDYNSRSHTGLSRFASNITTSQAVRWVGLEKSAFKLKGASRAYDMCNFCNISPTI